MTTFNETYFQSGDGLRLFCRDYESAGDATPVVCLHGLTRNSKDFDELAARLAAGGRRVLVPDLRGRGRSEHDPKPENYAVPIYVADVKRLLDELKLTRAVFIGASLGGIVTMTMAIVHPDTVQAAVLIDIGPIVEPAGVERIRSYVGKLPRVDNWDAAAELAKSLYGSIYPDFEPEDWMKMARRSFRDVAPGQIVADYDPAIATMFAKDDDSAPNVDRWALFEGLKPIPTLVIRGAMSDVLSEATVQRMKELKPDLEVCVVAGRGHPPLLSEPDCSPALEAFLAGQP